MHDPYVAKAMEYLLGIAFLVLFAGFWQYAAGSAAPRRVHVARPSGVPELVEWFRVAHDALFHAGHAWARAVAPGIAQIGVDDFAQKLVGRLTKVDLPPVGTVLRQGQPAWRLHVGDKAVDMLSPVDGVVSAVNTVVASAPTTVNDDPYARGWLLQVDGPQVEKSFGSLLDASAAREWLVNATNALRARVAPSMGLAMQDGGMPVDGIAHAIDPEHWDQVAREHLLS